ncbi:MAG TPA: permease [Candidatus Eisenbacteria bacterium]|nr:permease [Candidatus Eisenbacteria bacterium]
MNKPAPCCHEKPEPRFTWTRLALAALAGLVALSYATPLLTPFRESFLGYFRQIGPAVILGLLLGGAIERYVPPEYVATLLARDRKRTILHAVLFGFLMSACSHGILALAMQLHKKGASTPVVVSFLLASPWANLPITIILFSFFGAKALFILFGALAVATSTGLLFRVLERRGWIESNPSTMPVEEGYSILSDLGRRFRARRFTASALAEDIRKIFRGSADLARMTLTWILLGIGLSSLAAAFVPPGLFHRYMGASLAGLLATLALATVMEVCSEGTAPMAFELYRQTGAFGNAFVFLMAGVVTDYTEIALLWANIGRRTALWLPAVTVPQVVLLGIVANRFLR